MKLFVFYKSILFFTLFLILQSQISASHANTNIIFIDEFNGNGNLETINPDYIPIGNFNPEGKFIVSSNHLETSGFDPGYVYTGTDNINKCAAIDFNWSNGGSWTGIFIGGNENSWKDQVQMRIDGENTNWVYYKNIFTLEDSGSIVFNPNTTNTLKVCVTENSIVAYLNNEKFLDKQDSQQTNGYFGIAAQEGVKYLDKFTINSLETKKILDVPLIKQNDNQWKNIIYDNANLWSPEDPSIGSWGCALTSATMVFNYYGINKLPDKKSLNPNNLNNWLNRQPDGYIGDGHLNWLALSRLSHESIKVNKISSFDALEFSKVFSTGIDKIYLNIDNDIPDILEIPGHFIVSIGKNENGDIIINDPFYNKNKISLNSEIYSINTFSPSNTDLSYIMIEMNTELDLKLFNGLNQEVGETYLQTSISNTNNFSNNSPIKILYLDKPPEDKYMIKINSDEIKNYDFKIYLYDMKGQVFIKHELGKINDQEISIPLFFEKKLNQYTKKVTINSMILGIHKAFLKGDIKSANLKNQLLLYLTRASIYSKISQEEKTISIYEEMDEYLISNKNLIKPKTFDILIYELNYLRTHL